VKKFGSDPFRGMIAKARAANDFIIDKTIAEHGGKTPRGQKAVIEALAPLMSSMSNDVARSQFKKDLAERLGIEEKNVYRLLPNPKGGGRKKMFSLSDEDLYMSSKEGQFLHLLFTQPALITEARQYIVADTLTDGISGDIYSLLLGFYDEKGSLDGIIDRTVDSDIQRLISRMLVKPALEENIHEELVQKIIYLRRKYLKSRIRNSRILLKSEKDSSRKDTLVHQMNEDARQMKELDEGE
jgi:DNA primase